jgi:periplasmic copper chaperone A
MSVRFLLLFMIIPPISLATGAEKDLSVHDGWIGEAPPTASVLAGYMVIENDGAEPRRLIAAASPAFKAIELHRSVLKNGIASMIPQSSVMIPPAGGQVAFEPESYHLMMMEPVHPLRAGSEATVFLTFDGGEHIKTTLLVRKAASSEHHHH